MDKEIKNIYKKYKILLIMLIMQIRDINRYHKKVEMCNQTIDKRWNTGWVHIKLDNDYRNWIHMSGTAGDCNSLNKNKFVLK